MSIDEFLAARLDEDEQTAHEAEAVNASPWHRRDGMVVGQTPHTYTDGDLWDNEGARTLSMEEATAEHVASHDPARPGC